MSRPKGNGAGRGGPASDHPARGYTWPPFAPGNDLGNRFEEGNAAAVKHGAHSERHVAPLAQLARDELVRVAPWFDARAFDPAIEAWSWAEAQVLRVRTWLEGNGGELDEEGVPKPAAEFLLRLEKQAADARSRLGLDPVSLAKLQKDLGVAARDSGIAELMEEGRKARARGDRIREQASEHVVSVMDEGRHE